MGTSMIDSIAIQVCDMSAMVAFYTEAFDAQFEEVDVGGPEAWFGSIAGAMIILQAVERTETTATRRTNTKDDGTFTIENAGLGLYRVTVGGTTTRADGAVPAGKPTTRPR